MHRLDDFVRERIYQRLADWVMDHFERSCFWLAGQCAIGNAALYAAWMALKDVGQRKVPDTWDAACLLMIGWAALALWKAATLSERRMRRGSMALSGEAHLGPSAGIRVFCLLLFVWGTSSDVVLDATVTPKGWNLDTLNNLGFLLWLSGLYLLACYPRPPRRRRAVQLAMGMV